MTRGIGLRDAMQPQRQRDGEQSGKKGRRDEHDPLVPALAEQQIAPQGFVQRLVRLQRNEVRTNRCCRRAQRIQMRRELCAITLLQELGSDVGALPGLDILEHDGLFPSRSELVRIEHMKDHDVMAAAGQRMQRLL